jgi:tetratricopeptide (TPR) repeat protein
MLMELGFDELTHWGLIQGETWEPTGAAQVLERCVAADPGDRRSRLALSAIKRKVGALDEAEDALAGLAPDDPGAIAARARIALDRNDRERAGRLLASGPPGDPVLARLRGRVVLCRGDARTALRHFRIAYEAQPEVHEVLSGLIAALTILGDAKALGPLRDLVARRDRLDRLIQRAASKASRDEPDLPLRLGNACSDLHRDAEARGWYKLAIARNPLDSRAQRAVPAGRRRLEWTRRTPRQPVIDSRAPWRWTVATTPPPLYSRRDHPIPLSRIPGLCSRSVSA